MASEIKEQKQNGKVMPNFPYADLQTHPAWSVLNKALADLRRNDDFEMHTPERYVVGYLLQTLIKKKIVLPQLATDSPVGTAHAKSRMVNGMRTMRRRGMPALATVNGKGAKA